MSYRKSFQGCRMYGHIWYPTIVRRIAKVRRVEQHMECKRCGALKKFVVDKDGHQVGSQYKYADGYTLKGVKPHEVRADMRREHYGI